MEIKNLDFGFPLILIDNYYVKEELNFIWEELDFLCDKNVFFSPSSPEASSATDKNGIILKNNHSCFLDEIYPNRNFSNILTINRKLINHCDKIINQNNNWFFKNFKYHIDYTMVSYYNNNNYYKLHKDASTLTSLTWFYREPKKFKGGNLYFENNERIEVLNNRMVIFPSIIPHGVDSIVMEENDFGKKFGRFCITQFLQSPC